MARNLRCALAVGALFPLAARDAMANEVRDAKPSPKPPGEVASVCAEKQDLVRIVRKASEDPTGAPDSIYEVTDASGEPSRLSLDRKVDLNGDGNPDLILADPAAAARDARYLSLFVDCGGGAFYPLLTEYAADYEIGKTTAAGWKLVYLFKNISPEKPSYTLVGKDTYRFDGSHYSLVKSEKVKRRIF